MKGYFSVFMMTICLAVSAGANEEVNPANVDRAEVDQALSDLNDTLTKARAVPHFENGKPAGYKVVKPQPGSVYEKLELKNGDVIQEVNGERINDPQRAFEVMGNLKKSNQFKIVREGAEHTIDQDAQGEIDQDSQSQ